MLKVRSKVAVGAGVSRAGISVGVALGGFASGVMVLVGVHAEDIRIKDKKVIHFNFIILSVILVV
jgi:hypothetical protein